MPTLNLRPTLNWILNDHQAECFTLGFHILVTHTQVTITSNQQLVKQIPITSMLKGVKWVQHEIYHLQYTI